MNLTGTPPERRPVRLEELAAWATLIAVETLSQIAFRLSATRTGALDFSVPSLAAAASSPWLWLAGGCYLTGFVAWMLILQGSSLSRAFPASAAVFIATMIAARVVFAEPLSIGKLAGCGIIVAGIVLLGPDGEREIGSIRTIR